MDSGIYQITNRVNGNRYLGSTVNLRSRRKAHLCDLRHGQHNNQHLQRAFDKYGETAFVFSVLEHVEDAEQLIPREQYHLDTLSPEYNIARIAGSTLGCYPSPETRRKLSEARSGERSHNYGKRFSAETRAKMSEAHRGKPLSEEHRKSLSRVRRGARHWCYGKHRSEEAKQRMSVALKGRTLSEETKRKMSAAHKGKTPNAETREKMSLAQKARWGRVRGMVDAAVQTPGAQLPLR